jgi:hypothetical protein
LSKAKNYFFAGLVEKQAFFSFFTISGRICGRKGQVFEVIQI